jgi:hypothetical protein
MQQGRDIKLQGQPTAPVRLSVALRPIAGDEGELCASTASTGLYREQLAVRGNADYIAATGHRAPLQGRSAATRLHTPPKGVSQCIRRLRREWV